MIKSLIKSLISLVLTSIIFITSIFAWFVSNDNTSANNINGKTDKIDFAGGYVERFKAIKNYVYNDDNSIKSENYTLGDKLNSENVNLNPYDPIYDNADYVIYKITFSSSNKDLILRTKSSITRKNIIFEENDIYYNYLSNVINFYYLNLDNNTLTISAFPDTTSHKTLGLVGEEDEVNNISLIQSKYLETNVLYLLLKYNETNINKLFDNNSDVLFETVYFINDIEFYLE